MKENAQMFLKGLGNSQESRESKVGETRSFLLSELQTARNHRNQTGASSVPLLLFLPLLLPLPCLFVSASDELIGVGAD